MKTILASVLFFQALSAPAWAGTIEPPPPSAGTTPAAAGATPAAAEDRPHRPPRVTLVLSGGGARGAAHIGVLRVLEEMRVPVDLIVGTSMGSIVGGLYATGFTPAEIEDVLAGIDFGTVFVDYPQREDETFRRKGDDREFLIPFKLRFKGWKPYLPQSFLGGQRLEILLRTLEIQATGARDFDDFPIPFRAVATDLGSGEAVILEEGSLATAMRASMAVPGMFSPVVLDERQLVDGGSAANLPIGIAQDLGAGPIIAVDITSPLLEIRQIGSVFSVMSQMTSFLTVGNRVEDLKRLRGGDVLIQPELGDIGFADFTRAVEAVDIGEAAARAVADRLRAFSVGEEEYAAFQARHHRRPAGEVVVDEVRIDNQGWVADEVVRRRVQVPTGRPLDHEALGKTIARLHALQYFGTIRHGYEREEGRGVLSLELPAKPYGRNSLQFGVNFRDDFEGDAGYALAVRHQRLAANRRGGEWQNIGQIGETSLLATEFYQPIDYGMNWFVEPGATTRRDLRSLWLDGERVTEFRTGKSEVRIDGGRVLGSWGEIRLGAFYSYNSGEVQIGPALLPEYSEHDGGVRLRFRVDTFDDTVFPRRGMGVDSLYSHSLEGLGADTEFEFTSIRARGAWTFGRNTVVPNMEAGSIIEGPTTLRNAFTLGGLLRLSGLGTDELIGSKYGLASVIYYYELAGFDLGALSPEVFAGATIETGNTYVDGDPVTWRSLLLSGAIFVGARTPIGPVFLGYGVAEGGRDHVYLNIGTQF